MLAATSIRWDSSDTWWIVICAGGVILVQSAGAFWRWYQPRRAEIWRKLRPLAASGGATRELRKVEIRNTPPRPPVECDTTANLVEDLCRALRNVGLSFGERAVGHIKTVQRIHNELVKRGESLQLRQRIAQLSLDTRWQMERLLAECLAYPAATPQVRESDGIRRHFRCPCCEKHEYPDWDHIALCDLCLARVITAVDKKEPFGHIVIYRTYNPSWRCEHADDDTVLVMTHDEDGLSILEHGLCRRCLTEEQERRLKLPPRP